MLKASPGWPDDDTGIDVGRNDDGWPDEERPWLETGMWATGDDQPGYDDSWALTGPLLGPY